MITLRPCQSSDSLHSLTQQTDKSLNSPVKSTSKNERIFILDLPLCSVKILVDVEANLVSLLGGGGCFPPLGLGVGAGVDEETGADFPC